MYTMYSVRCNGERPAGMVEAVIVVGLSTCSETTVTTWVTDRYGGAWRVPRHPDGVVR